MIPAAAAQEGREPHRALSQSRGHRLPTKKLKHPRLDPPLGNVAAAFGAHFLATCVSSACQRVGVAGPAAEAPSGRSCRVVEEPIQATPAALTEALELSAEILRDIELTTIPLANVALKASRLARLLNDFDHHKIMQFETSGYSSMPDGFPPDVWYLMGLANRQYEDTDIKTGDTKTFAYGESIEQLEQLIAPTEAALAAAKDPAVSISSSNPSQYVFTPIGNIRERMELRKTLAIASARLASRRAFIYDYVLSRHYELKFSGVAQDVFSLIRQRVDRAVGQLVPDAIRKFDAVHENLQSGNPEDWSNAAHSCRRILQDLADAIFPPQEEPRVVTEGGKQKTVELGPDHYINRIICFVEDNSDSERFADIVGSHLRFLGDRLDAVFRAAQKGSHATIGREEADRYVVYAYMIVGDVLSLWQTTVITNRSTGADTAQPEAEPPSVRHGQQPDQ